MRYLLTLLILLLSGHLFCFADEVRQESEFPPTDNINTFKSDKPIRLISPVGTMVRSTVFPGWGQFHSRNYFRGSLVILGIGSSAVGAFLANQSLTQHYNDYLITASNHPDDSESVLASYDKANQRYKLRMFFIYTGIGIWVYSIIDSYVSANFYNANSQVRSIQQDAQQIEQLGLKVEITPSRLYFGYVNTF